MHLLDAGQLARLADTGLISAVMRGVEVRAYAGIEHAGQKPAGRLDDRGSLQAMRYMLAVGPPMSEITPVKARRLVADLVSISLQDRALFRAVLDDAALVLGDRAERAAAETAAHDGDREPDHLPRRDLGVAIARDAARGRRAVHRRRPSPASPAGSAAASPIVRGRRGAAPGAARCRGCSRDAARGRRERRSRGRPAPARTRAGGPRCPSCCAVIMRRLRRRWSMSSAGCLGPACPARRASSSARRPRMSSKSAVRPSPVPRRCATSTTARSALP